MNGFIALLAKLHPANWLFQDRPGDDEPSDATAEVLRDLIPQCPQCCNGIDGHLYCLAASCVLNEVSVPVAQAFLDAIDGQNWTQVFDQQGWEAVEDDLELYFIACPNGKRSAVVVFSPFAFELPHHVMRLTPVPEDADVANFLQTRKWSPC